MKSERNILIAFIFNLLFSIFEGFCGFLAGSVAIVSDALHDIGDAISIGISYFLEKKSKKQPDERYTYGYARFSVVGSIITTFILVIGSFIVIFNAIKRIISPIQINYDSMIVIAIIGVIVNFIAAFFTHKGDTLNQKAVNLHMIEDLLGWIVVLVGAIIMKFTNLSIIDPIMSIGVAVFILIHSVKNLKEVLNIFLEKIPDGITIREIKEHILEIDGVIDVHHIHIWSMDGINNFATMHIITDSEAHSIKEKIRKELNNHKIFHTTLELETPNEDCNFKQCYVDTKHSTCKHHH